MVSGVWLWLLLQHLVCLEAWPLETAAGSNRLANIWIPNVRDTFITGQGTPSVAIPSNYNIGDVVAEFDVGTGTGPAPDVIEDYGDGDDSYERCEDPKSKITLFPLDNFDYPGNDLRKRPLTLSKEVFQLGRFRRGPTPTLSVVVEGSCCW